MIADWANKLRCPGCASSVAAEAGRLRCGGCGQGFAIRDGAVVMHCGDPTRFEAGAALRDDLITRLKLAVKRYPRLFDALYWASGAFVGLRADEAVRSLPADAFILNLGSGAKAVRRGVVNVDYHAFPGVELLADAARLPIKDNVVDAVICESLLEHVDDPAGVASEISRVLKPGGLAYILTPFILGYHSSPADFRRWTRPGLMRLFPAIEEVSGGIAFGPTMAFNHVFASWLALPLSLGSASVYQLVAGGVQVALAPLTLLDWVLSRHPNAEDLALAIYFLGKKR